MTAEAFNRFCAELPHTTHVVQWGGADVWKIGGKVFAIARPEAEGFAVSIKVSPIGFEILKDSDGYRPAPYLASRGMKWIQSRGIEGAELHDHVTASYRLIAAGLPKKVQVQLGLKP